MRLGRGRRRRQRTWQLIPQNLQEPSPTGDGSSGCRKSRWLFSTACNNAGIFVPRSGTKILASLHARLAEQGLARHLIRFEAGFAPSSSPCEEERLHARQGFIDTQKSHPRPGMALLAKPPCPWAFQPHRRAMPVCPKAAAITNGGAKSAPKSRLNRAFNAKCRFFPLDFSLCRARCRGAYSTRVG